MDPNAQPPTILVIDFDWTYQFWVANVLINAGFRVVPARSVQQAENLIQECGLTVALLILDPTLTGTDGIKQNIGKGQGNLRVIAAVDASDRTPLFPDADAVLNKPDNNTDLEGLADRWLSTVRALLYERLN